MMTQKLTSPRFTLYYDKQSKVYCDRLSKWVADLKKLGKTLHLETKFIEKGSIDEEEESVIAERIRTIIPQERGSIVTSRGQMLPLSKTKRLNLSNTPIILVERNGKLAYVFPCRVGERYYGVDSGVEQISQNWPNLSPLTGVGESSITNKIVVDPSLLGEELTVHGVEVQTSAGIADVVLRDSSGSCLLIEAEREATDSTVGQILKLSAGYEKIVSGDLGAKGDAKVRSGIVCFRIHKFVLAAARRAGIEVWRMSSQDRFELEKLA